jgi:FRG domain
MTAWPEHCIATWEELQEFLDPIQASCVFRGQANRVWPLITSFNRIFGKLPQEDLQKVDRKDLETFALWQERQSILRFRSEAHLHLPQSLLPPDPFKLEQADTYLEWLMLMQHYGAPTRLLDWTNSPYVALYFAVIDDSDCEAAISYFDPTAITEAFLKPYQRDLHDGKEFDFVNMKAAVIQATEGETILYTATKKMRTAREIAQQGLFTFANRVLADHEVAIAQGCNNCSFGRIILPRKLKREFTARLNLMNVTAAAIFPGVEGICGSIRDKIRLDVQSLGDQLHAMPAEQVS